MRIAVGADHAGWALKERLADALRRAGHEVEDCGTHGEESVDYPDFAAEVARRVAEGRADRGVLVCGTGIGMAIVANRFAGVRAAVCHDDYTAEMSRRHNDANILCVGGRVLDEARALRILDVWMSSPFDGGRHSRRVAKIDDPKRGRAPS
jgi:ribose 5-phosphate isomerase B